MRSRLSPSTPQAGRTVCNAIDLYLRKLFNGVVFIIFYPKTLPLVLVPHVSTGNSRSWAPARVWVAIAVGLRRRAYTSFVAVDSSPQYQLKAIGERAHLQRLVVRDTFGAR